MSDHSEALALNANERIELEQFRLANKLTAAGYRSMAAELQRLQKFCRDQEPIGEVIACAQQGRGKKAFVKSHIGIGTKLYENPFAGDYLTLIELWKGLRDLERLNKRRLAGKTNREVIVNGRPMDPFVHLVSQISQTLEALLHEHDIEISHQDYSDSLGD